MSTNEIQIGLNPIVKIAINNSKSISTGYTPYEAIYGFQPNFMAFDNNSNSRSIQSKVPAVETYVKAIKSITQHIKGNIQQEQINQKYYADMKRIAHQFKVGDFVYVDALHFKISIWH